MDLKAFGNVKQEIIEDAVLKDLLERANQEAGKYSDDDDDEDENDYKRPRLHDDERVQRCRERNRVHARNTRERKRAQMELLQQRIQELSDERRQLEEYEPDSSIASILMSLSSCPHVEGGDGAMKSEKRGLAGDRPPLGSSAAAKSFAAEAIERIRAQIAATLSDEEELEIGSEFQLRDKSQCSTQQLETIRRERNRMHAKKTRLRKKKMLTEMEAVISNLEQEIKELRRKLNLHPTAVAETDASGALPGSGAASGSGLGSSSGSGQQGSRFPSKFTGFRHMQNKTLNGVTTISGLRGVAAGPAPAAASAPASAGSGNSSVSSASTSTHRSGSGGPRAKSGQSSSSSLKLSSTASIRPGGSRPGLSVASGAGSSTASAEGQPVASAQSSSAPGSSELSTLPLDVVLSMFPMAQTSATSVVTGPDRPRPAQLMKPEEISRGNSADSVELCSLGAKAVARSGSIGTGSTTSESGSGSPTPNPVTRES